MFKKDQIPLFYFNAKANVGDELNIYLIERIAKKKVYKVYTGYFSHLRAIGSIIGGASSSSYIWGSGSIDGKPLRKNIKCDKIFALRGHETLKLVRDACNNEKFIVPLGDPALLTRMFYSPVLPVDREKKVIVGVVLHYADVSNDMLCLLYGQENIKFIDVKLSPEKFIDEIVSCEYIISSSLHGLILSDVYDIPNVWVKFGNKIIGGEYKFNDYYSTTTKKNGKPVIITCKSDLLNVIKNIVDFVHINKYLYDVSALLDAFPVIYK